MARPGEQSSVPKFPIVCLAGSAGALKAYREILRELPARTGMAFVISTHRSPDHAHLLAQILSEETRMPVIDAENRVVLKPDHVFIIPPLTETTTNGVVLYVRASSGPKQEGWPVTISAFLFSLATTCKARAVVVILSGMGDDGSSALASIKAKGGATLVQSDPSYKSMPDSANCTGFVDHVLTATNIGKHLAAMC